MLKRIFVLLLLLPTLVLAQVGPPSPRSGGGGTIGPGSATTCTANSLLYADAATLLACGGAPAPTYDSTNIRLTVGSTGTSTGWSLGYEGTNTGYAAMWPSTVTPGINTYSIRATANNTTIGSSGTSLSGSISFAPVNVTKLGISAAAGAGPAITCGTATTDLNCLSLTTTLNNGAINFNSVNWDITDTASGASTNLFRIRGGAAGTTNVMSLSKTGRITLAGAAESILFNTVNLALTPVSTSGTGQAYKAFASGYANTATDGFIASAYMLSTSGTGASDTILVRGGAAGTFQLGADVNGAAVAQTLKAHDGITGSNIAGANLTIAGGRGTGAGAGGNRIDQTSNAVASGTTAQTLQDRTVIVAKAKDLTAGAATNVVLINVASGSYGGGSIEYTVQASDATDHQARSGRVQWAVVNKAGTETCTVSGASEAADSSTAAVSAGTLTYAITTDTSAANGCYIAFNAVSSLTETVLNIAYRVTANGATTTLVAQ